MNDDIKLIPLQKSLFGAEGWYVNMLDGHDIHSLKPEVGGSDV